MVCCIILASRKIIEEMKMKIQDIRSLLNEISKGHDNMLIVYYNELCGS